jgi:hypothetical protein
MEDGTDLRLRMRPELHAGPDLHVHAIADLRAQMGGTDLEGVPVAAWAIAETPVGNVTAGRMPIPMWGLGLIANPGGCLDCISDFTVDRVGFVTELGGHIVGLAWDLDADDIVTGTLTLGQLPTDLQRRRFLDAGHDIWGYGIWSTWRTRSRDGLGIGLADGWIRFENGDLRIEAEGVFAGGRIRNPDSGDPTLVLPEVYVQQSGGAAQVQWRFLDVEVGFASGDTAPGRGIDGEGQVNPPDDTAWTNLTLAENHFVDRIQWRRRVGKLTDVAWVHPGLAVAPAESLALRTWFTASTPLVSTEETLAPEFGVTVTWEPWHGLQVRTDAAYLVDDGAYAQGTLAWLY